MDRLCSNCTNEKCDCFLRFNHWINNGKDWYWVIDNTGRYVWSSPQCESITGFTADEMIGKKVFDMLPERDRERVIGFLHNVSANYSEYNDFEMIHIHKTGREVYISVSGSPIFNKDGSYFGYRGVTRDISEYKKKEWELQESRTLWDRAQKANKIASWEQNIYSDEVFYSNEMYNMFELEYEDTKRNRYKEVLEVIHPEDRERVIQANREIMKKVMHKTIDFRLRFPDGRIKYLTESLESIANDFGDVVITTGVLQDITQIHTYHEELNRKIRFEHYTAKIAERFVMVREHDKTLDSVLAEIGELIEANRTYIFEFNFRKNEMSNTYEWCDEWTESFKDHLQKVPLEIAEYWLDQFKRHEAVQIDDVDAIPDDRKGERETLQLQSIKSLLALPIYCEDELWGFFGLDNTEATFCWDQEILTVTKVFTQIMQNFLEKKKVDEKIKAMNRSLEIVVENKTHDLRKTLAEMKATRAHFDLALKSSDIGVWTWDFENEIVPDSFAFSKYFKHVVKVEMYEHPLVLWEQSIHPDFVDIVFSEKAKFIEGLRNDYSVDYKIWLDSQNDWRWINSTGAIVERDAKGNPKIMVGAYKDITESKENELILENARQSAERQVKNKSEFLSNLNHELRTPLTIILGNTEMLMYSDIDKELKSFIKTTNRAANQLLEIIEDIVDLSKIDEGSVEAQFQELDSKVFFEEICEYYKELADNARLDFSYEISAAFPETFVTDPKLFKKICNNIVGNAVKFTKEGQISLSVTAADDELVVSVSDTGIGIPEDKLPIIFERFTQADSSSKRRYGGTGLGLAIAKSAIDILKGGITVESKQGKGSTFSIHLPRQ